MDGVAKETNATLNKQAILDAIDAIQTGGLSPADKTWLREQFAAIDTSGLATESNATLNKEAVLDAIDHIHIDIPQGIALESNATLNKQEIEGLIGTPAQGQPATLFGAIAAGGGGGGGEQVQWIAERLGVTEATEFVALTDTEIVTTAQAQYASVYQRPIVSVSIDGVELHLRSDKLYGGVCPDTMGAAQDAAEFTGYGYAQLYDDGTAIDMTTATPQEGDVLTTNN